MKLARIMVAPNGARKSKADHPALPVTIGETVETDDDWQLQLRPALRAPKGCNLAEWKLEGQLYDAEGNAVASERIWVLYDAEGPRPRFTIGCTKCEEVHIDCIGPWRLEDMQPGDFRTVTVADPRPTPKKPRQMQSGAEKRRKGPPRGSRR